MRGFSRTPVILILLVLVVTIICVTSEIRHRIKITSPDDGKVTIYTLTRESSDDSTVIDISHSAVSSANPVVSIF